MYKNNFHIKKTALVSALMLATGGHAATINVDGVTCNINDAITAANTNTPTNGCTAGSGPDVLELPDSAIFDIGTNSLPVTSEVTINANNSTIESTGTGVRILTVTAGSLILNDATIQTTYAGVTGGVVASGAGVTLNINRSVIKDMPSGGVTFANQASGSINDTVIENTGGSTNGYYGAGLSVGSSTVTVTNSTISNNSNADGPTAGGIWVNNYYGPAALQIVNSTITGNSTPNDGGGIGHTDYGNGSTISLSNVTLAANNSTGNGGGISNDAANITISQSIISGNTGTGGTEINSTRWYHYGG